jgi:hypothetical protein
MYKMAENTTNPKIVFANTNKDYENDLPINNDYYYNQYDDISDIYRQIRILNKYNAHELLPIIINSSRIINDELNIIRNRNNINDYLFTINVEFYNKTQELLIEKNLFSIIK